MSPNQLSRPRKPPIRLGAVIVAALLVGVAHGPVGAQEGSPDLPAADSSGASQSGEFATHPGTAVSEVATPEPTATVNSRIGTSTMSTADVASNAEPSVVQILTPSGAGTGFKMAPGVIANEHVVSGLSRVELITSDQRRFGATVSSTDKLRDLALLAPDKPLPDLQTEPAEQQRQGDELLVLGYPKPTVLGVGGTPSLTRGILSALRQENGVWLVQTDAPVILATPEVQS